MSPLPLVFGKGCSKNNHGVANLRRNIPKSFCDCWSVMWLSLWHTLCVRVEVNAFLSVALSSSALSVLRGFRFRPSGPRPTAALAEPAALTGGTSRRHPSARRHWPRHYRWSGQPRVCNQWFTPQPWPTAVLEWALSITIPHIHTALSSSNSQIEPTQHVWTVTIKSHDSLTKYPVRQSRLFLSTVRKKTRESAYNLHRSCKPTHTL